MNEETSELDIVQSVEDVLGIKLLDFQKQFVSKVYEAYKKDELNKPDRILYTRGGGSRTNLLFLYEICLIIFEDLKKGEEEE